MLESHFDHWCLLLVKLSCVWKLTNVYEINFENVRPPISNIIPFWGHLGAVTNSRWVHCLTRCSCAGLARGACNTCMIQTASFMRVRRACVPLMRLLLSATKASWAKPLRHRRRKKSTQNRHASGPHMATNNYIWNRISRVDLFWKFWELDQWYLLQNLVSVSSVFFCTRRFVSLLCLFLRRAAHTLLLVHGMSILSLKLLRNTSTPQISQFKLSLQSKIVWRNIDLNRITIDQKIMSVPEIHFNYSMRRLCDWPYTDRNMAWGAASDLGICDVMHTGSK